MLVEYKAAQRKLEGHAIAEKIDGRSKIPLGIWKWMTYSAIHLGAIGGNNDADIFTQNEEKDICGWEARAVMLLMA